MMRNAEGYFDPTAGIALKNLQEADMEFVAGDIVRFTIRNMADKYFVVMGVKRDIVTGISLRDVGFETSVMIPCNGEMYAWPERIEYVNVTKTLQGDLVRTMSDTEMEKLHAAVAKYLGIEVKEPERLTAPIEIKSDPVQQETAESQAKDMQALAEAKNDLLRAQTEAGIYKELYMTLLEKTMRAAS